MRGRSLPVLPISVLLGLVVGCTSRIESSSSTEPPITTAATGSVTGVVRGSGWPLRGIVASPEAPGQPERITHEDYRTGSFTFDSLSSGRWTIRFLGLHPYTAVFPGMRLYADTAITVTVEPDRTIDLREVVLRPVDPFIVVAITHCRWGFSNPPTLEDWMERFWPWGAPVDVRVDVDGVVGTPTSGWHYSFSIKAGQLSFEPRDAIPGDYVVSVAPAGGLVAWRLVPWQSSNTRLHLDRGMAFALFSFWRGVGSP